MTEDLRPAPRPWLFRAAHPRCFWAQAAVALLGAWLVASPATLGYSGPMALNDLAAGLALLALGLAGLDPRRWQVSWAQAVVGAWLLAAPLVFWTPSAAAYLNGTLVGALVIGLAFVLPSLARVAGPDVPAGWTYNPSAWRQRAPILALAVPGFLAARYMAAFQLGHIEAAWDPLFGSGTEQVLTSEVSRAWPVSDAGLGALVYLAEALTTVVGDPRRWRTMPWLVVLFGVQVIPLSAVSIALVFLQPVAVGAWCTLCLLTAALGALMIPLAADEVLATGQYLRQARRRGEPLVRTLLFGGEAPGATDAPPGLPTGRSSGVGAPWNLVLMGLAGLAVMAAPALLATPAPLRDSEVLAGAVLAVLAVSCAAEVARPARLAAVPLGLWIAAAPWLLGGPPAALAYDGVLGFAVVLLALRRGRVDAHYGAWDRVARWRLPAPKVRGRAGGRAA